MGTVAEPGQRFDDGLGRRLPHLPVHRQAMTGQVEARTLHPVARGQAALDLDHACGTGDPFHRQIHVGDTLGRQRHEGIPVALVRAHGRSLLARVTTPSMRLAQEDPVS